MTTADWASIAAAVSTGARPSAHHSRRQQGQPLPPAHAAVHEVSSPTGRRVRTQPGNSHLLLLLTPARLAPCSHGGVDQKNILLTAFPDAWLVTHSSRGTSATHGAGGEEPSSGRSSSGMASGGTFRNLLLVLPLYLALASLVRTPNCSSRISVPSGARWSCNSMSSPC